MSNGVSIRSRRQGLNVLSATIFHLLFAVNSFASSLHVKDNGKVGIGTASPSTELHVKGIVTSEITHDDRGVQKIYLTTPSGYAGMYMDDCNGSGESCKRGGIWMNGDNNTLNLRSTATGKADITLYKDKYNNGDKTWMGIGEPNWQNFRAALHVNSRRYRQFTPSGWGWESSGSDDTDRIRSNGTSGIGNDQQNINLSIYATEAVAGKLFYVFSDERIKNVKGQSNSEQDLETLQQIVITDYTYRDQRRGTQPEKKVLGQQLRAVFPQAVTLSTDVVADIMRQGQIEGNKIVLNDHGLNIGDRVNIVIKNSGIDAIYRVLSSDAHSFVIDHTDISETGPVMVIGREVHDFHTVDYDAVAMLNVSATQALARQNVQLANNLSLLKNKLKALEANNAQLIEQISDMKNSLCRSIKPSDCGH